HSIIQVHFLQILKSTYVNDQYTCNFQNCHVMSLTPQKIRIIGVPLDLGQNRRGVDMGPAAIRCAGLREHLIKTGHQVEDFGNIPVPVKECLPQKSAIEFAPEISSICNQVYQAAAESIDEGFCPIFLGGDHSIAIGSIGGITVREPSGVVWIDAHGDYNIPQTSPNGNIHGMPVAVLTGIGLPELVNAGRAGAKVRTTDIVYIGTRNLDFDERTLLKKSAIKIFSMKDIDENGIAFTVASALESLSHLKKIHVSLDMDALDPIYAPGVGTPDTGGLTYREAHLLMELLSESKKVCSMDIVEVNPVLDHQNQTAQLAVELAGSLFGRSIL
ncbi:MAG TPA: arginase, partial [Chitinispirillaceae bacterium]|nr:arginase [Chitinispirillaceae bacterium]